MTRGNLLAVPLLFVGAALASPPIAATGPIARTGTSSAEPYQRGRG